MGRIIQPGTEGAEGADPAGDNKGDKHRQTLSLESQQIIPVRRKEKGEELREKPLVRGPEASRLRPQTPQSSGRLTHSLLKRATMP